VAAWFTNVLTISDATFALSEVWRPNFVDVHFAVTSCRFRADRISSVGFDAGRTASALRASVHLWPRLDARTFSAGDRDLAQRSFFGVELWRLLKKRTTRRVYSSAALRAARAFAA